MQKFQKFLCFQNVYTQDLREVELSFKILHFFFSFFTLKSNINVFSCKQQCTNYRNQEIKIVITVIQTEKALIKVS